jgi:DNA-binding NarL/FixJ family response regulator
VTRIVIAEDHPVVRAGLATLLRAAGDLEVVGAAGDGEQAVALVAEHQPDLVLMDLSMPGMDGREATERIVESHPGVRVVVLTSFSDREDILATLDAGAVGYMLKDAEPQELIRGLRAAASGGSPLAPKAARALVDARRQNRPADELTAREREVLALLGQGLPNKLIAQRLSISEKTVKAHVTRILQALNVTDRTQAALWAQRRGIA